MMNHITQQEFVCVSPLPPVQWHWNGKEVLRRQWVPPRSREGGKNKKELMDKEKSYCMWKGRKDWKKSQCHSFALNSQINPIPSALSTQLHSNQLNSTQIDSFQLKATHLHLFQRTPPISTQINSIALNLGRPGWRPTWEYYYLQEAKETVGTGPRPWKRGTKPVCLDQLLESEQHTFSFLVRHSIYNFFLKGATWNSHHTHY
jgi:hypothetical protein